MADDKQIDYQDGVTPVPAEWLDRMQEVQQGLGWNINLVISGTSIVLQAGSLENTASIVIKGKMRLVTSPLSINFTGSPAGTYGIWANTTNNDSVPTFTLQSVLGTGAPAGVTYTRKIATVVWSGTALSNLLLLAPYVKHGQMHQTGGSDPLPNGSVGTDQIVNNSVTGTKIADNSVGGLKFTDEFLQTPIVIGTFQPYDVAWLPNPGSGSNTAYRGQLLAATGGHESFGRRNSLGTDLVSGGYHRTRQFFPNIIGLKRQVRISYEMTYGGFAGVTAANITIRDAFATNWNFGINVNTPSSISIFQGTTSWVNADSVGFPNSGLVSATEERIAVMEALANNTGGNTWWVCRYLIWEGRYSRV